MLKLHAIVLDMCINVVSLQCWKFGSYKGLWQNGKRNMLIIEIMKNLDAMLGEVVGKSVKAGFSVNSVLFEILKDGKKLSREELKMEMLKFRFVEKFGEFKDEYFKDEKMLDEIKKLSVTSRNSIDTIISKNNSNFIFKDIKGFEKSKVVLESGKYFIK